MALQVWLPLTKDLRQQGLSNTITTNHGTTYQSTSGKLGGCYKTSSSGYLDLGYNGNQINSTSLSFGGWFKFNQSEISSAISGKTYTSSAKAATGNLIGNNSYGGISLQWNSNDIYTSGSFSSMSVQSYLRTSTNGARATSSFTLPFDTWIHIFLTYNKDENILGLWINGELKYTYTQVTFTDAVSRNLVLNYGAIAGGNGPSAYIPFLVNDVRIYDHCLSPMEVKELAKGLVLHYPLNRQGWGQENLASQYVMPGGNSPGTISTAGRTNYYGDYGIIIPATENADTYFSIWYSEPLESGATYTLSAEVSGLLSGSYYNFPLFAQNNTSMGIIQFNHNGLNKLTFTMNYTGTITTATVGGKTYYRMFMDDNGRAIASGQGAITIKNIKLEKGSIATPWCPNSSDALATTMGLNGTTEYDCSGFCNNGTRTGTFTWTSDTPKYAVSQNCLGTNYIYLTPPSTEVQTMAVWVKWNTIPSGQSVILVDNGSGIGLGLYSGGILCSTSGAGSSYAFSKANLVANTWYHFVVVKTGTTTRKLYINGVEQTANSSSSNWSYSVNQLQLGKRSTTSDGFVGKLSDFRAYATALSAEDVKSLYQNEAYIDSLGTIRGQIH